METIKIIMKNDPLNGQFTHCPVLTMEQANALGITSEHIASGEMRGNMETRGPWCIISSYSAIVCHRNFPEIGSREDVTYTFWPRRKLSKARQSGYQLEGRVSIAGKSYSAFTANQLVEIDGHLVDLATIFPRLGKETN